MPDENQADNPSERGGNASFFVRLLFSGAGSVVTSQPHYGHAKQINIDSGMQSLAMVLDAAQLRQLAGVVVNAYAEIAGQQATRAMLTSIRDDTQAAAFAGRITK